MFYFLNNMYMIIEALTLIECTFSLHQTHILAYSHSIFNGCLSIRILVSRYKRYWLMSGCVNLMSATGYETDIFFQIE